MTAKKDPIIINNISMNTLEELGKLKKLLDDGVITDNEFISMKRDILRNSKNTNESTGSEQLVEDEIPPRFIIKFKGQFFLWDVKTRIYINGELLFTESTTRGFEVEFPLEESKLEIKVMLGKMKTNIYKIEDLDVSKSYRMLLIYDNGLGKYKKNAPIKELED